MLFELPTTIESYKMIFVFYFFLIRNSFRFIFLFVQNMSLCAQHSSRLFADRSLRKLLSPLFFFLVLFSKCTAYSLRVRISPRTPRSYKISRRDSDTFASLSSVVKASSFYDRVLFIFFSLSLSPPLSLSLSLFYFLLYLFFCFFFVYLFF